MSNQRTKAEIISDIKFAEGIEELGNVSFLPVQIAEDADLAPQKEWSAGYNGTIWSQWSPNLIYPELKSQASDKVVLTWSEYHDQYWSYYRDEQESGFYNVEHFETTRCSLEELILRVAKRSYLISGPNWVNNCSGAFDGYPNIVIHQIEGFVPLGKTRIPFEVSFGWDDEANTWPLMVKKAIQELLSKSLDEDFLEKVDSPRAF
jgi:hypothetical protein